jgi:uncharacterized protein
MAFSSIRVIRTPLCACSLFSFLPSSEAQISIVDSGATGNQVNLGAAYTQSFDTLANTNTAPVPWVDNDTLDGWYAYRNSTGPVHAYNPSQSLQEFGSFGILGETDRALGSGLGSVVGDFLHFGVRFANDSSSLVTGFDISFDGEQWFYGNSFPSGPAALRPDSLSFSYQIFDAGQGSLSASSGWNSVSELLFTSPISTGSSFNRPLNGNLDANRAEGLAETFTGLTLAPGQELWLRWTATNNPSITDDSLAIENLTVRFSTVPEPAACAALVGSVVFMAALRRRRR